MSTLGGSRGERQAKPKFAALNINQLYKHSRGESLEPSTQKNQVPRKHGMQSLGKVPSARRPPANLPSLKAEINSPATSPDQQQQAGNQISIGVLPKSTASAIQTANSSNSPTNINNNNSNSIHSTVNNSSSSISTSGGINNKSNNNSADRSSTKNLSHSNKSNASGGGNTNTGNNSSSSSVTWSSVTTGGQDGNNGGSSSSLPPLYQSPQFQHEFPSLDGSTNNGAVTAGSGQHLQHSTHNKSHPNPNQHHYHQQQHIQQHYHHHHKDAQQAYRDGNSGGGNQQHRNNIGEAGEMQHVSLRPQTDTASWLQHQQIGNGGKGGGGGGNGVDQMGHPNNMQQKAPVPPQYLALMPSFMYRGGGPPPMHDQIPGGGSGGSRSLTPPMNHGGGGGHHQQMNYQMNGNYPMNQARSQRSSAGIQDQTDFHRTNSPGYRKSNSMQKRPPSIHTPPGGGGGARSGRDKDSSMPFIEPEVALVQRPIIREEDLERMDSISKDDGWTKQDDIDYNQKLTFSDDESPESTPSGSHGHHSSSAFSKDKKPVQQTQQQQQQHRDRHLEDENRSGATWTRASSSNEKDKERDNLERDRNERNDRDRHDDRQQQQNGHRNVNVNNLPGGLEPAVFERVKQRKEEEEKRESERKQAAAKKLQELEMKMHTKKTTSGTAGGISSDRTEEDYEETKVMKEDESYAQQRGGQTRIYRDNNKDSYGRYDKYDRDRGLSSQIINSGGQIVGSAGGGQQQQLQRGDAKFSAAFQSNLPPRFLKQQQSQPSSISAQQTSATQSGNNYNQQRPNTANNLQQQQRGQHDIKGSSSSVSFNQQYDSRHGQSQNYKSQPAQQSMRRNPSSEEMLRRNMENSNTYNNSIGRRRGAVDSEDDDRFSTGSSRNQERPGNNLARSISGDSTNNRKTSVSSDDQKLTESFHSIRSSWAEETESERRRNESFSSDHNHSGGSCIGKRESSIEDIQPKQILQRPQTKSISESTKKDDDHKKNDELLNQHQQKAIVPTQILRRSESPQDLEKKDSKIIQEPNEKKIAEEKTLSGAEIVGNAKKDETKKDDENSKLEESSNKRETRDLRDQKRPSPRGGSSSSGVREVRDNRDRGSRSSYGSYRGGGGGNGSWSRRGASGSSVGSSGIRQASGGSTRNYNDQWSESGDSDDDSDYRRSDKSSKSIRKDTGKDQGRQKEGFAPRGEPSRRGRGGSITSSTSSYRRGDGRIQTSSTKRVDSTSSFSSSSKNYNSVNQQQITTASSTNEDNQKTVKVEIEDKTKLNQIALTSGLQVKKDEDKMKTQQVKSSSPQIATTTGQQGKRDDKKPTPPKTFSTNTLAANNASNYSGRKENISKVDSEKVSNSSGGDEKDVERKKSLSKEKEFATPTQKSQSSSHLASNRSGGGGTSQTQYKKDDRQPQQQQKSITKPPPGLGFKTSGVPLNTGNISQPQVSHKDQQQALLKSKSSGDARSTSSSSSVGSNNRTVDNKSLPPRMSKQWDPRNSGSIQQQLLASATGGNAWEKPLQQDVTNSISKNSKDGTDSKIVDKSGQKTEKVVAAMDGGLAPVNTIIFENTNYKTQVPIKRQMSDTSVQQQQLQQVQQHLQKKDDIYKSNSLQELQNQQQTESITTALSQMSFGTSATKSSSGSSGDNDYDKDIKLGFAAFDTEFRAHLNDDKNTAGVVAANNAAGLCLQRPSGVMQHGGSVSQNTISPSTADLNMKIASVKKVWESVQPMPTVMEHGVVSTVAGVAQQSNDVDCINSVSSGHLASNYVSSQQQQQHLQHIVAQAHAVAAAQHAAGNLHNMQHALSSPGPQSYGNTFESPLDHFGAKQDVNDCNDPSVYSPSPQHMVGHQQHSTQQQSSMALKHASEVVMGGNKVKTSQQQNQLHQAAAGLGLSPPPTLQQQQNSAAAQMHQQQAAQQFYQPSQYNTMPTIPSPPAVLFNSSPMASQAGLYTPFQLDPSNRSQFSQYPGHYGSAGSGPYNAYMQTGPNMQTPPTPDMYQNLTSQFRMGGGPVQTPYNQTQQLNNPNTVLISSSANSLMSASVKQSSQQIGAIGSKSSAAAAAAAAVGQQFAQQYMNMYTQQAPPPPPQLQSNSYYSNSGGGQGGFYGGPTAAGNAQTYGLPGATSIFGGHGGPGGPSSGPPPTQQQMANFSSQFTNSPLLAGAINQYRGAPNPQTSGYMKTNQGQSHMQDSMGRQLKSPLGADVSLSLGKQQSQQSPPHHKTYASWDLQNQVMQQQQQQQSQSQQNRVGPQNNLQQSGRPGGPSAANGVSQRYPTPIQRPTNYPQHQQSALTMQQSSQQQPQTRPMRHPGGPPPPPGQGGPQMNKHYYSNTSAGSSGNRGHPTNPSDQHKHSNDQKDIVNQTTNQLHHQQQQQLHHHHHQQQQQQHQHQQQSDLTATEDNSHD